MDESTFELLVKRQLMIIMVGQEEYRNGSLGHRGVAGLMLAVAQGIDIALRAGVRGLTYNGLGVVGMYDAGADFFGFVTEDGQRFSPTASDLCDEEDSPIAIGGQRGPIIGVAQSMLETAVQYYMFRDVEPQGEA